MDERIYTYVNDYDTLEGLVKFFEKQNVPLKEVKFWKELGNIVAEKGGYHKEEIDYDGLLENLK